MEPDESHAAARIGSKPPDAKSIEAQPEPDFGRDEREMRGDIEPDFGREEREMRQQDRPDLAARPGMLGYDCPDGDRLFGSRRAAEEAERQAARTPEFRRAREAERAFSTVAEVVLPAIERLPARIRESVNSIFYRVAMIPVEANPESSMSAVRIESRAILQEIRKMTAALNGLGRAIEALPGPVHWLALEKVTAALNAFDGLRKRLKKHAPAIAKAAQNGAMLRSQAARAHALYEARALLVSIVPGWYVRHPALPPAHVLDQGVERLRKAYGCRRGKPAPKTIAAAVREVALELLAHEAGLSAKTFEKLLPREPR